ncbi:MAG: hypothetical protein J1F66_04060 [Clostridiales bacterium]|nr:hypothetical protein [Clostridiales bacterium]
MKSTNVAKGKKIASIIGICIASILVIFAFCGRYTSGGFKQFANFFVGALGMSFYGIMAALIVACSFTLAGKSIKIPIKYIVHFALMFVALVLFVHILTTTYMLADNGLRYTDFSQYINYVYHYYDDSFGVPTFGGALFGMLAYAFVGILTIYGAVILVTAVLGWTVYVVGEFLYSNATGKLRLREKTEDSDIIPSAHTESTPEVVDGEDAQRRRAYNILFQPETTNYPEEVTQVSVSPQQGYAPFAVAEQSELDSSDAKRKRAQGILFGQEELEQPTRVEPPKTNKGFFDDDKPESDSKKEDDEFVVSSYRPPQPVVESEEVTDAWKVKDPTDSEPVDIVDVTTPTYSAPANPEPVVNLEPDPDDSFVVPFDDHAEDEEEEPTPVTATTDGKVAVIRDEIIEETDYAQERMDFVSPEELKKDKEKENNVHKFVPYENPPYELLDDVTIREDLDAEDRQRAAQAIVDKYAVFKILIEPSNIIVGPSVTRYMFNVLSQKTRMDEFKQYANDIKACIEAQEDVIIYAPVHGTNQIGIDVANKVKAPVVLRAMLEAPAFQHAKGKLVFAIGQEITGKVVVADLSEMPHLLIAGTTGSGKSVALNCLIVSMMYKYGPEYVRFVMVDPKFVELSRYNGIPHMLTSETITTMEDALAGMDYLISEMDSRYQLFRAKGVGNIGEYNSRINSKSGQKLPYLVFIVDELADLMSTNKKAFESKLGRLAQKSRAAGIHIVLATQRPDVSVITGTIKANLPCRMALKVSSQFDSTTIIGSGGAEKLLGRGDMLFLNSGASGTERIQGAYITNDEIRSLVEFLKAKNEVYYDQKVSEEIFVSRKREQEAALEQEANKDPANKESQLDPLCKKALRFWLEKQGGRASIASIQRNLGIGFNRAGRIMDSLQKLKYVEELSPSDPSSKPLRVLVTLEQLDELFPDMQD